MKERKEGKVDHATSNHVSDDTAGKQSGDKATTSIGHTIRLMNKTVHSYYKLDQSPTNSKLISSLRQSSANCFKCIVGESCRIYFGTENMFLVGNILETDNITRTSRCLLAITSASRLQAKKVGTKPHKVSRMQHVL